MTGREETPATADPTQAGIAVQGLQGQSAAGANAYAAAMARSRTAGNDGFPATGGVPVGVVSGGAALVVAIGLWLVKINLPK